jgi:hypothetical protein
MIVAFIATMLGCEKAEPDAGDTDDRDPLSGSWVTWSPYKWDHDGYPVTGNYC